jgi:hypothetical protein
VGSSPKSTCALAATIRPYISAVLLHDIELPKSNPHQQPPPNKKYQRRVNLFNIYTEVTGFFNWPHPSSCTMPFRSTQPLTKMGTRNIFGGKVWPVSA